MLRPRPARSHWMSGLAALIFAALAAWGWQLARPDMPATTPLSASAVAAQSRRIEVTLADIEASWARLTSESNLPSYTAVAHRFFVGSTPSPCRGAELVTGAFYCRPDLVFDLGFFAALTPQLRETEDLASKLLVATIAAAALRDQLGILDPPAPRGTGTSRDRDRSRLGPALQADCLAGLWAGRAADRIGPVRSGLYAEAIQGARRIAARRVPGTGAALDDLDIGALPDREAAFRLGHDSGQISACLRIDPAGGPSRATG